jgi:hypothetical protein
MSSALFGVDAKIRAAIEGAPFPKNRNSVNTGFGVWNFASYPRP